MTIWYLDEGADISQLYKKEVSLDDAIDQSLKLLLKTIFIKLRNPLYGLIYKWFGVSVEFSSFERQVEENCLLLRAYMLEYVKKRRTGHNQGNVKKGLDMLSLFLQSPDVFNDEFIVDELLDFFSAAT